MLNAHDFGSNDFTAGFRRIVLLNGHGGNENGLRVITDELPNGEFSTEATVKAWVGEGEAATRHVHTAEGNGPVNALDLALRKDLGKFQAEIADLELVDFKVRILDGATATGAVTRVLLDATNGEREWTTIGVSSNIIEASWQALVDSLEYGMQPGRRPAPDDAA